MPTPSVLGWCLRWGAPFDRSRGGWLSLPEAMDGGPKNGGFMWFLYRYFAGFYQNLAIYAPGHFLSLTHEQLMILWNPTLSRTWTIAYWTLKRLVQHLRYTPLAAVVAWFELSEDNIVQSAAHCGCFQSESMARCESWSRYPLVI